MESPRIIKTHLSWQMLPLQITEKNIKIIYVTRNPRDCVSSLFNHLKILDGYTGHFETVIDCFLKSTAPYYLPFIPHVLEYWEQAKTNPNVCFITYEEMKEDLPKVIKKVSSFLGKNQALNPEQMSSLCNHLSFDKMKQNQSVNKNESVIPVVFLF